ncbi:MAG: hypothetical protein HYY25_06315 [Candidatus Wallbacteria bacterium]|nr:hypothetical protein [Candidatus Wallbacteria bacterium]
MRRPSPEVLAEFEERKLAPYRKMTPQQRLEILAGLCEGGARLRSMHAVPDRIRNLRQPRSKAALEWWERLRVGYRWRGRTG